LVSAKHTIGVKICPDSLNFVQLKKPFKNSSSSWNPEERCRAQERNRIRRKASRADEDLWQSLRDIIAILDPNLGKASIAAVAAPKPAARAWSRFIRTRTPVN
jgi:hypothetical protein